MKSDLAFLLVGIIGCSLPAAYLVFDFRRDRKQKRATLTDALDRPAEVRTCWAEGPDGDGYSQLFVQMDGARPVDVSTGRDLDVLLVRLIAAGVVCDDRRIHGLPS